MHWLDSGSGYAAAVRGFCRGGIALPLVTLLACGEPSAPPLPPDPTLRLLPEQVTLRPGEAHQLQAEVTGTGDPAVVFVSSNPFVAAVSAEGRIAGLSPGVATITAGLAGFPTVQASSLVRVTGSEEEGITISVAPQSVALRPGESLILSATVHGTPDGRVTWRSLDPRVVTVDEGGRIVGRTAGTAVVIAASVSHPRAQSTAVVNVLPAQALAVNIAPAAAAVRVGSVVSLDAWVTGGENPDVEWESGNPAVAQVDAAGNVFAIEHGIAVILARVAERRSVFATAVITVGDVGLQVEPPLDTLLVGQTRQMAAAFTGAADLIWSTSDPLVATVDVSSGRVRALTGGTALISARPANDPTVIAAGVVVVKAPPAGGVSVTGVRSLDPATGERTPLGFDSIAGLVEVVATVAPPAGFEGTVALAVDGAILDAIPITGHGLARDVVLTLQTAAFDSISGAPRHRNGEHTVSAWLITAAQEVRAAGHVTARFRNPDGFASRLQLPPDAVSLTVDDQTWWRGDVEVALTPVIFSGTGGLERVTAGLCPTGGGDALTARVDATRQDGFRMRFPVTAPPAPTGGGLAGIEGPVELCVVSSEGSGGRTGPTLILNQRPTLYPGAPPTRVHIDAAGPAIQAPFTLAPGEQTVWITDAFSFTRGSTGLGAADAVVDAGSGLATCGFRAGVSFDALMPVARGSDLPESATDSAYVARVVCSDRLGNATARDLTDGAGNPQRFGVDYGGT